MELIKNKSFGGERPLFGAHDVRLEDITITDGESGIKCCQNIECHHSKFYGKYPWWHVDGSLITDCYFAPESRSAIWYSDNMVMKDCTIDGPKFFREMKNLDLENVNITDADETFWKVDGLKLKNVKLHDGTYPFMFSKNIYVDGLESDSKYVFQYCRNVEIHNAKITTKDSFWECENVTVYDSELNGEYLAWHSKNIKFVRCHISGEQPLCYMDWLFLGGLLGLPGKLVAQLIVQGAQQPAQGIFVGLQGGDLLGRGQENAVEEVLGPVGVLEPVTGDSV